jgi:pimeloyl-ACP methyl ester carboxylesterase
VEKRIVLLHGWGASSLKLKPLADDLKKHHWEVINFKLPGFELSSPKAVWNLNDYANHIDVEVKKIWHEKGYFVFGHSFGGRITIKLTQKDSNIKGIILCSSGGLSRGNVLKRMIFLLAAKMGKILVIIPGMAHLFKKVLYKAAHEHDYEKSQGIMKDVMKNVVKEDLKKIIHNIKIPVLVIWGDKDKMTPVSDAYFLKNKLKNSHLVIFPNEGHKLPYNKPSEITLEIEKWYQQLS